MLEGTAHTLDRTPKQEEGGLVSGFIEFQDIECTILVVVGSGAQNNDYNGNIGIEERTNRESKQVVELPRNKHRKDLLYVKGTLHIDLNQIIRIFMRQ